MTIDHDAVLRARGLLLGSGRPSRAELVGAYRVLAEASPKAYGPRLVDALLELRYDSRDPDVDLALAAEAARVARGADAGDPNRGRRLREALNAYQASLFALGRRTEGRAICRELAEAGWSEPLANALAEEGRFTEAAEVDAEAARDGTPKHSFWEAVRRAANLEGAGLYDAASAVFGEHLGESRRKAAEQPITLAIFTWELVHFSRLRETAGDGAGAAAARLPELADVRRRIGIRAAVREGTHPHRFEERFTPYFDEGVALARRLPGSPARLARTLTDRSMFLVAARSYAPAHADFAEAVALDAPAAGGPW